MNERPRRSSGGRPGGGRSGGGRSGGGRSSRPKPKTLAEDLHPIEDVPDIETFTEWELGDDIQQAIRDMNITSPTPIQRLSIGAVLAGKDVIAKAETGTGKTLAFGAPMIARMDPERATVLGMVLCPTRELAQQVADVLEQLGATRNLSVALVVGGDKIDPQIRALQAGAQVIVGTPGRVLDLYNQRFLQFPWTEVVVLDEADKMFEIGFIDDIRKILSFTPEERQTLLFSATFPPEVLELAREQTTDPVEVATAKGTSTVANIDQRFLQLSEDDCPIALVRMLEQSRPDDVFLVFCERRTDVDQLMRRLERLPFMIKALHGGYDQAARFRVMSAFRTGEVKALIATDVAARGLDVNHVTHVVNFAVPREIEDYAHRIGRTGRAGRDGTAITFVTPRDSRRWRELTNSATWDIEEMDLPERDGRRRGRPERGPARGQERGKERGERGGRDEVARGRDRDRGNRADSRPRRSEQSDAAPPRRTEGERERRPRREEEQRPAAREPEAATSRAGRPDRDENRPRRRERGADQVKVQGREGSRNDSGRNDRDKGRGRERTEAGEERRGSRDENSRRPRRFEGKADSEERPRSRPREEAKPPVKTAGEVPFGVLPPVAEEPREKERVKSSGRKRAADAPAAPERVEEARPASPERSDDGADFGAGL